MIKQAERLIVGKPGVNRHINCLRNITYVPRTIRLYLKLELVLQTCFVNNLYSVHTDV